MKTLDKLLRINPEFTRNILLELSTQRLIAMPVILGGLFFLIFYTTPELSSALNWTLLMYAIIVCIKGTSQVSRSIIKEIRAKTWDFQRMTIINPWSMVWGKLFGSSIYSWYGGIIIIIVYFSCIFIVPEPLHHFKLGILAIFFSLFLQSMSMLSALVGIRSYRESGKEDKINHTVFYAFAAFTMIIFMTILSWPDNNLLRAVRWYTFDLNAIDITMLSIFLFTVWVFVGLYRLMKTELQFQNSPWVWLYFQFFLFFYFTGFIFNFTNLKIPGFIFGALVISFLTSIILTYVAAFFDSKNIVDYERLTRDLQIKAYHELIQDLPLWLHSLIVTWLILLAMIYLLLFIDISEVTKLAFSFTLATPIKIAIYCISMVCFVIRDLSIMMYIGFSKRNRNGDLLSVIFLFVLYLLVPEILHSLDIDRLNSFFYPIMGKGVIGGLFPIVIEIVILLYLLWGQIRTQTLLSEKTDGE
ncbi:MAG: hypothetical protein HQK91_00155 [Nitrospirae bacterium]|nr:hypothetical protein [Nitrospirota bacterium]MBF0539849.1 hypothetical protein [Nitrospirota bacterium]